MSNTNITLIIMGIWGSIILVGTIIKEIAKIKANSNPLSKLFGGNNKKDEDK